MDADDDMQPEPRYTLQEAADALGWGERDLFRELRRRRILDQRNVPTWRYKDAGLFLEHRGTYRHPTVGTRFYSRPLITSRGLRWLQRVLADQPVSA